MFTILAQAAGLGIAGIDPVGAVLLLSAITSGASRTSVIAFTACALVASVAAGVALTLLGRGLLDRVTDLIPSAESSVWAYVEAAAAVAILAWVVRARRRTEQPRERRSPSRDSGTVAFAVAGTLFSATAVIDPTFLATAAVVGPRGSVVALVVAFTVWTVISQFMLVGLFGAYLAGKHEPLLVRVKAFAARHRPAVARLVTAAAVAMAMLLLVDALWYAVSNRYLLA